MYEYHAKLGNDGRIVLPAKCRRALDIAPGDELVIEVVDHEARIFSLKQAVKKAQNEIRNYVKKDEKLTEELSKLRKEDYNNESGDL